MGRHYYGVLSIVMIGGLSYFLNLYWNQLFDQFHPDKLFEYSIIIIAVIIIVLLLLETTNFNFKRSSVEVSSDDLLDDSYLDIGSKVEHFTTHNGKCYVAHGKLVLVQKDFTTGKEVLINEHTSSILFFTSVIISLVSSSILIYMLMVGAEQLIFIPAPAILYSFWQLYLTYGATSVSTIKTDQITDVKIYRNIPFFTSSQIIIKCKLENDVNAKRLITLPRTMSGGFRSFRDANRLLAKLKNM